MLDDFVWRGLLGGLGVALVAGPLGCLVVWRRMAYFGDSLAHSALLGLALGFALSIDTTLGILLVCTSFALLIVLLQRQKRIATDTILGILAHSNLAIGIVAIGLMETLRIDLMGYLFGDMLAVTRIDLLWIYGGGALVLAVLAWIWRPLIAITVNEELAAAEGIRILPVRLAFTLLLAVVVAIAMKIVGVLLIVALLIIPAAAARPFSSTPERMAVLAALFGCLAVGGGMQASLLWNAPTGPAVVVMAFLLFLAGQAAGALASGGRA